MAMDMVIMQAATHMGMRMGKSCITGTVHRHASPVHIVHVHTALTHMSLLTDPEVTRMHTTTCMISTVARRRLLGNFIAHNPNTETSNECRQF